MSESVEQSGIWVLIPAAGVGSRMSSDTPKQYLKLQSKTILEHTIACFANLPDIEGIVVVVSKEDEYWSSLDICQSSCQRQSRVHVTTTGGAERSDTVVNGLVFLRDTLSVSDNQWVMVHDAARPCVKQVDLLKLMAIRRREAVSGGILAAPVKDTMKRTSLNADVISRTESREGLWHALTPQMFRLSHLIHALVSAEKAGIQITDEASAVEYLGDPVALVEGASDNIKLTTPADLPLVEFLLHRKEKSIDD